MEEIWKPINGFEGLYEVSNHGRIKSLKLKSKYRELILSPRLGGPKGKRYYQVSLGGNTFSLDRHDSIRCCIKVHRLVALHFVDNPDNKPCINHKDSNKLNNRADNLEFCTIAENNQHSIDNGNRQRMLVLNTETGIYYEYMREAAEAHGIRYKNLSRWLNGTRKNNIPFLRV